MKKTAATVLAICMIFSLCACGSSGGGSTAADPGVGKYTGVSADVMGTPSALESLYEKGTSIELQSGGKGTMELDGSPVSIKWKADGKNLSVTAEGTDYAGTIDKDTIVLDLLGVKITFGREGTAAAKLKSLKDNWNGDWYGYWTTDNTDETYSAMEGGCWDCCATIKVAGDDTAVMSIWDADGSIADVNLKLTMDDALTIMGCASSTGGTFSDAEVTEDEWSIDPGLSDVYPMLEISGMYYDQDYEGFSYYIYLLPWGASWDGVSDAGGTLPPGYEDTYLPAMKTGTAMTDGIGFVSGYPTA
jgi:hypothetical protein